MAVEAEQVALAQLLLYSAEVGVSYLADGNFLLFGVSVMKCEGTHALVVPALFTAAAEVLNTLVFEDLMLTPLVHT